MGSAQSGLQKRRTQADETWNGLIDQLGLMSAAIIIGLQYKNILAKLNTRTNSSFWLEASSLTLALTLITLKSTNPLSTYLKSRLLTTSRSPPFRASTTSNDGKQHLLLACTGSVATVKLPNILHSLSSHPNLSIKILLTTSAQEFLQSQSPEQPSLTTLSLHPNVDGIYTDADEWNKPWVRGDAILHIELRRWADLLVIAPLSANSLAKVAMGMSDNLITSVVRAWDGGGMIDGKEKKGVIVAPAMNTAMWEHAVTKQHVSVLEGWEWVTVLRPVEKELACGDTGSGAMKDWREIVGVIEEKLGLGL